MISNRTVQPISVHLRQLHKYKFLSYFCSNLLYCILCCYYYEMRIWAKYLSSIQFRGCVPLSGFWLWLPVFFTFVTLLLFHCHDCHPPSDPWQLTLNLMLQHWNVSDGRSWLVGDSVEMDLCEPEEIIGWNRWLMIFPSWTWLLLIWMEGAFCFQKMFTFLWCQNQCFHACLSHSNWWAFTTVHVYEYSWTAVEYMYFNIRISHHCCCCCLLLRIFVVGWDDS